MKDRACGERGRLLVEMGSRYQWLRPEVLLYAQADDGTGYALAYRSPPFLLHFSFYS